jgi:hypothetical protein
LGAVDLADEHLVVVDCEGLCDLLVDGRDLFAVVAPAAAQQQEQQEFRDRSLASHR